MKTEPIKPAQIGFGDGAPSAPLFDDVYQAPLDAVAQARRIFLNGNGLPRRWAGRQAFTILEAGFGLGHNFLATWDAWRADAQRCERLHFVAIERHPPRAEDLARAHVDSPLPALAAELVARWPALTPNMHVMDFEDGRVQLLLALGDVARLLPELRAAPDAFFLDGFAPAHNPAMWQPRVLKALGRMAAPDATLATWNVSRELHAGLVSAGFEVQLACAEDGGEMTSARHAPRFTTAPKTTGGVPGAHAAIVVGAGIAGAAVTRALLRAGLQVTVIDSQPTPSAGTSGNPAGLFHGTVHPDDGRHARLFRAAALVAQRDYGTGSGLLRLGPSLSAMRALLQQQGLPAEYVEALDASDAAALAGVALPGSAWWYYPGGGSLAASDWVGQQLDQPGVRWLPSTGAQSIARDAGGWAVHDAADRTIAAAPILVLANAAGAADLLGPLGHAAWPLTHSRGQVTWFASDAAQSLRLPVAGDGYAIPLGQRGVLCGASRDDGEPSIGDQPLLLREADHRHNIDRLHRLSGLTAPADSSQWSGRAGWRLQTADRLPIAGALPLAQMAPGQRLDQVRLLPRERGLFVLTALGARGLTLAPLLGRLIAAQATGSPWPLEQDLADAVDPARWLVRTARREPRP